MNSIDKQQPEDNTQNLGGNEAIAKMKELAEKAGVCFFCTGLGTNKPFNVRPMSPQKIDDTGAFWFLSASDSHKNADIKANQHVQMLFQGSAHSDFMTIYGNATISKDKEKIKELWKPLAKTWFTEGEDDPRITVIKIEPSGGFYWDNKHGNAVAFVKMLVGAAIGKTLDDSVTGELKP